MKRLCRALLAFFLLGTASIASAQLSVPSGASFALGGGSLDLANSDLQVSGLFSLASGSVQHAANIAIGSGGTLDGGSGLVSLSGNWSDSGSFLPGSGNVDFVDGGAQSQIDGNTSFANLSFVSTTGKSYLFAVGTVQTVANLLTISGTAAQPIQFRSTTAGQVANINLLAGGTQSIAHVGVSDVHATGQHLAPSLSNEGGSGNATGWFAAIVQSVAVPATALSSLGLLLFGFALLLGAWSTLRHRFE